MQWFRLGRNQRMRRKWPESGLDQRRHYRTTRVGNLPIHNLQIETKYKYRRRSDGGVASHTALNFSLKFVQVGFELALNHNLFLRSANLHSNRHIFPNAPFSKFFQTTPIKTIGTYLDPNLCHPKNTRENNY